MAAGVLRVEMRNAIKRIQQQVGITTLYVTHDQEEALAVSDRIAVMNGGVIQQIDTPKNIYQRPSNLFVSTFIGLSNIMDGTIDLSDGCTRVRIGDYTVAMDNLNDTVFQGQPVKVSVRPEEFIISRDSQEGIPAIVRSSVFLGVTTHYFVETEDGLLLFPMHHAVLRAYAVLAAVSSCCPPVQGRLPTRYSPVRH